MIILGEAEEMDYLLDRYLNILGERYYPPLQSPLHEKVKLWWSETHLKYMLMDVYGVCLFPNNFIFMIKVAKISSKGIHNDSVITDGRNATLTKPVHATSIMPSQDWIEIVTPS